MGMAGVFVVWERSKTPKTNQEVAKSGDFFFSTDLRANKGKQGETSDIAASWSVWGILAVTKTINTPAKLMDGWVGVEVADWGTWRLLGYISPYRP